MAMKNIRLAIPAILLALAAGVWFVPKFLQPGRSTTIEDPVNLTGPAESLDPGSAQKKGPRTGSTHPSRQEGTPQRVEYVLLKPARQDLPQGVKGTVISRRGGALAGAKVYLMKDMDTATLIQRLSLMAVSGDKKLLADLVGETRTDANGRFQIGAEPKTGEVGYQIHVRAKGHIHLTQKVFVKKNTWEDLGLLQMDRGGSLQGRVLDAETGSPVAKAKVKVLIPSTSATPFVLPDNEGENTVTANALGYYRFESVLPLDTPLDFEASGKGYARGAERAVVLTGKDYNRSLDLELEKGWSITGRVTGPDDKGLPRVKIRALPFSTESHQPAEIYTDNEGFYQLPDLREGQYTVEATRPGYGMDARTPVRAGDEQVNLRLEKASGILVTVVDKKGKPVRIYNLEVKRWFDDAGGGSYGRGMPSVAVRNADGEKEIGGLEAGDWAVQVTSKRFAKTYSNKFTVPEGPQQDLKVKVVMNNGGAIEGFVYDATGKPVAGATIETLDNNFQDNPFIKILGGLIPVKNSQVSKASNSKGRFLLQKLTPGSYQIRIQHPAYSRHYVRNIVVTEGQKTVLSKIVVEQGCRVKGRVLHRGIPAVHAKVSITMQPTESKTPQHYVFDTIYTDTKGQYESSRQLPAGKYEINAVIVDTKNIFQTIIDAQRSKKVVTLYSGPKANIVDLLIPD